MKIPKHQIETIVDYIPPSDLKHLVKLKAQIDEALRRHGITDDARRRLKSRIVRAVEHPSYGNGISFEHKTRGRPPDFGAMMLAAEINEIFLEEDIAGNSLRSDDDKIGVIAEIEAIAQTARKVVWGVPLKQGVSARPARLTTSSASLGPVTRPPVQLLDTDD